MSVKNELCDSGRIKRGRQVVGVVMYRAADGRQIESNATSGRQTLSHALWLRFECIEHSVLGCCIRPSGP